MNFKKIRLTFVLSLLAISFLFGYHLEAQAKEKNLKDGKAIIEKVIEALGGQKKMEKPYNAVQQIEMLRTLYNPTRTVDVKSKAYWTYTDKYRYEAAVKGKEVVITADGTDGWFYAPPDNVFKPLTKTDTESQLAPIYRDPVYIAQNISKFTFELLGEKDVNGTKVIDILVTGPRNFNLYIDPLTHYPFGIEYDDALIGTGKNAHYIEYYSDYRDVDGIKVPFKTTFMMDGLEALRNNVIEHKFNTPFDKDLFKPIK